MQDPGNGALRLNATNQNTATAIAIDHQDDNGTDISTYLATIDASTSTIKGHVKITKKSDSSKFILATISAETDQTGWHQVTIAVVGSSATSPFSNADDIVVTFARTGDKGDTGAGGGTGAQGHQGRQGVNGTTGTAGAQGATGAQGHQGVQGAGGSGGGTGAQGHQGRQGAAGAVEYAVPSGGIIIWSGAANAIPSGWVLCNGSNSTPNLSGRFVVGYSASDGDYDVGDTGGNKEQTLSTNQIPSHTHGDGNYGTNNTGSHTHGDGNYGTNNTGSHSHSYNNAVTGTYNEPRNLGVGTDGGANSSGNTNNAGNHSHNVTGNSGSGGSHSHNVTGNSGSTGGGQLVDVRPPYYALCYIMKT
jgi:microcystin-dependent protein